MRGRAQRVARPAQTRLQNAQVTGLKFTEFLKIKLRWVMGDVNARIRVAILPSVVECQRTD